MPGTPAQTVYQQEMLRALEDNGQVGLADAIYDIARREDRLVASNSWAKCYNDQTTGKYALVCYLYTLPRSVLRGLIQGNLPYARLHDVAVRRFMAHEMHVVQDGMGVYVNLIHRPDQDHEAGKWLSPKQVQDWIGFLERYGGATTTSNNTEAKQVDQALVKGSSDDKARGKDPFKRRYPKGAASNLKTLRHYYVPPPHRRQATEGFQRIPGYVGCSQSMTKRLNNHRINTNTNQLHAFWNAALVHSPRHRPSMQLTQVVVFLMWDPDWEVMSTLEVGGSVLMSSYFKWGGLNGVWAGSASPDSANTMTSQDPLFTGAARQVFQRPHIPQEMLRDWQTLQRRRKLYDDLKELPNTQQKVEALQKENTALKRSLDESRREEAKLRAKIEGLQQRKLERARRRAKESAAAQQLLDWRERLNASLKERDARRRGYALVRQKVVDPDFQLPKEDLHLEAFVEAKLE